MPLVVALLGLGCSNGEAKPDAVESDASPTQASGTGGNAPDISASPPAPTMPDPSGGGAASSPATGGAPPLAGASGEAGASTGSTAGGTSNTGGTPGQAGKGPVEGGAGAASGTAGSAGAAGASDAGPPPEGPVPWSGPYLLGADISSVQEAIERGATFVDTDGQTKSIFELLLAHGFNTIRLRTFVEPGAEYGYGSCGDGTPYCDTAHTAAFGKQVKDAGMHLLLDLHYSDTWADPGKQVIPEAWRDVSSIEELAARVRDYTEDTIDQMIAAGARPDMVQVGNEITPGMLIHVPTANTDCYGNNSQVNPSGITGQASEGNWDNLATLLRAGIEGVKASDPSITIMLHLENTESADGVAWWLDNARSRGVEFDVLGLSCYTAFQDEPSVWRNTFQTVAAAFEDLQFVIAEYNPARTEANLMMLELGDDQGIGTFFWEPTQSGSWGEAMFTRQGNTYRANAEDFAEYDELRSQLGL